MHAQHREEDSLEKAAKKSLLTHHCVTSGASLLCWVEGERYQGDLSGSPRILACCCRKTLRHPTNFCPVRSWGYPG